MIDASTVSQFLDLLAKIAPIVAACIAAYAANVARKAIEANKDTAHRRAALDFFLKTEMDDTIVQLYKKFKTIAPKLKTITSMERFSKTNDFHDVRVFLNICELIAVGINIGGFSERVSHAYWGDVLPQSYRDAKPLIDYVRRTPTQGTDKTYLDLEKLCERWEDPRYAEEDI